MKLQSKTRSMEFLWLIHTEVMRALKVLAELDFIETIGDQMVANPDGHSKCPTYGQSNCSTPATVN